LYFVIQILIKIDSILYFKYFNDILPSSARIFTYFLYFCNVANETKEDVVPTSPKDFTNYKHFCNISNIYKHFRNISETFLTDRSGHFDVAAILQRLLRNIMQRNYNSFNVIFVQHYRNPSMLLGSIQLTRTATDPDSD